MKKHKFMTYSAILALGVTAFSSIGVSAVEQCPSDITRADSTTDHYDNLQTAVNQAGDGGIVKIAGNCKTTSPVEVKYQVTIDGNKNTITYDATDKGDYQSIFNMAAGSAGSTIKNIIFDHKGNGYDDAAIYFGYGFDGTEEKTTTITDNTFNGNNTNVSGIMTTYDAGINHLNITGNTFKNLKYGMYFNSINDAIIIDNSIMDIKYNAINIAGDNASYLSKHIEIASNIMTNIATANYEAIQYASGINIGLNADKIQIHDNTIIMAEGENATKDIVIADAQKDITIEDNGDYADMTKLAEIVEEVRELDLDKYTDESVAALRELLEDSEYYLDGAAKSHLYAEQGQVNHLTLSIKRAIGMLELKPESPKAPDTGANRLLNNPVVASALACAVTGSMLALVMLSFKYKMSRE